MSSVQAQPPLGLQFNASNKQIKMTDDRPSSGNSRLLGGKRPFNLKSDVETVPEENDFGDNESCEAQGKIYFIRYNWIRKNWGVLS